MDFSSRFSESLKSYMDVELMDKIQGRMAQTSDSTKLFEAISTIHDYYNRVLRLFFPFTKEKPVEEQLRDHKGKRRPDYGEKAFLDFKQSFLNHLKFSMLDKINYSALFQDFIQSQFPLWKQQADQAEFDLSSKETEDLGYVRRLLLEAEQQDETLQRTSSTDSVTKFDAKVARYDPGLEETHVYA